ncbi:MotA/TolQ/ExbB proton channel family protein [Microbulbifer sp. TYP-18]|uniref:MotA/TolQ/ExbB proton channel family protein n=1 Tax=Microbulbifer sp. TYP-18 TaxID=3230024 RepID=UPI0034C6CF06
MSGLLNQIFLSLSPAMVTDAFLVVMLAIFAMAVIFRFVGVGRSFLEQAAGFLTSLGILGTFVGIIIGLYGFSLDDIDRSIADLMAGLKTAFITSVIGLALSLLLRAFTTMLRLPSDPAHETATIDDLNRNLVALQESLASFSRSAGEEMVSSLERVVDGFNLRLQAQFGDNLRDFCAQLEGLRPALNAVASEYMAHAKRVESWSRSCDRSQRALTKQQDTLAQMFDRVAQLPQVYRGLDQLLARQAQQTERLERLLRGQSEAVGQLAELLPQLPQNLELLSRGLVSAQGSVDDNLAAINSLLGEHSRALTEQFRQLSVTLGDLQALNPEMLHNLVGDSVQVHRDSMRELAQVMATNHREMSQALTEVIRKELREADISIRRQYEQMDRVMAHQVDQVLSAMGEALATLSGSFTRDYRQLVTQMQRLKAREPEYAD